MFRIANRIQDVYDFLFVEQGVLLVEGKKSQYQLKVNDNRIGNVILNRPGPVFIADGNDFYYSEFDGKNYRVDIKTGINQPVSGRYMNFRVLDKNECLIDTKDENIYSEIINILTGKTLTRFEKLVGHNLFSENFYCCLFDQYDIVFCFNRKNYYQEWVFDVSAIGRWIDSDKKELNGEIVDIIGTWEGLLLLHITMDRIVAINNSGSVEWQMGNFIAENKRAFFPRSNMFQLKSTVNWELDKKHSKLYFGGAHFIMEFDLNNREQKILNDYSAKPDGQQWRFRKIRLQDNYILFSGNKSGSYPNSIGIFDLDRNEITWEFTNDPKTNKGFFVMAPVLRNNKLYVRDDQNVLYEFEPE